MWLTSTRSIPWQVWDLMEAGRHKDAEALFDRFMTPYNALVDAIMAETAGKGIFVRPGLEVVGLAAGVSRLPSRDTALTPEIKQAFRKLLDDARAAEDDAA